MKFKKEHTGLAIAIAWPETWCKQPGAWYDGFINRLGISKHHYYKVGHAALVLIDSETYKCHYFDFGRYHTPFQHGRVRSEMTDDGLKMNTAARISGDGRQLENFEEILTELQQNPECHGEGKIHASYSQINFNKAFHKALQMQQSSPIRYGPFRHKGSNCSRFVNTALRAGNPTWEETYKLTFLVPFTPTPLNNVNSFGNKTILPKLLPFTFTPSPISNKSELKGTLTAPVRASGIPTTAQWLSGEGAGSWFAIGQSKTGKYFISRFGPDEKLECEGEFTITNNQPFNIDEPYRFDYLSHCRQVKIIQNHILIEFERTERKTEETLQDQGKITSKISQQKNTVLDLQTG